MVRSEVDRCRAIPDQMSGRAGGAAADDPEWLHLPDLLGHVRDRFAPEYASRLQIDLPSTMDPVWLPQAGFVQAVASLVKNAFDAGGDHVPGSHWRASSGNTFSACWPTATAMCLRPRACSVSTGGRCNESCPRIRSPRAARRRASRQGSAGHLARFTVTTLRARQGIR